MMITQSNNEKKEITCVLGANVKDKQLTEMIARQVSRKAII